MRRRVWFHRFSAVFWALFGPVAFLFGWQDSVALVWIASAYANFKSDWGAAEAADDSAVLEQLAQVRRDIAELRDMIGRLSDKPPGD